MTQVLVTSGISWTVPADCISAEVECIGGGQSGNATNGGNGGDYAKVTAISLTPGASVTVQIGAGGAGVASGSQNAGTDTKFSTVALAKGGGSASTDIGSTTFTGGAGDASGAGGAAAGATGVGASASGMTPGAGDGDLAGAGGAPAAGGATPTVVEAVVSPVVHTSSTVRTTTTPSIAVLAGDTILAVCMWEGAISTTAAFSVTDSAGNTYTQDGPTFTLNGTNGGNAALFHAVAAAGATITVSGTGNRNFVDQSTFVEVMRGGTLTYSAAAASPAGGSSSSSPWLAGPITCGPCVAIVASPISATAPYTVDWGQGAGPVAPYSNTSHALYDAVLLTAGASSLSVSIGAAGGSLVLPWLLAGYTY